MSRRAGKAKVVSRFEMKSSIEEPMAHEQSACCKQSDFEAEQECLAEMFGITVADAKKWEEVFQWPSQINSVGWQCGHRPK